MYCGLRHEPCMPCRSRGQAGGVRDRRLNCSCCCCIVSQYCFKKSVCLEMQSPASNSHARKNGDFSIPMRTQALRTFWNRHAQNGFQLKMRLRRLDKRFWREVSTKENNESEGPKKKNEMHSILYYLTCSAKFMYFFTYKCSLE